jgi:pimeloyl-ACP methyl ester carboxylesterase
MAPTILTRPGRPAIAYHKLSGATPGIVFLGGFRSDMTGTKASALADFAARRGHAFLRFDYRGHGASEGLFEAATISTWLEDCLDALDHLTDGAQILVGSSMGGWLMMRAARERPERIAGLIGIAAAPDFTEALIWEKISAAKRLVLQRKGVFQAPSAYDPEGYPITYALIEDGRRHLVLGQPIPLSVPVRLIHGMADAEVPWEMSRRLLEAIEADDVSLTLVKNGDHRLSKPHEINLMLDTLARLLDRP